MLLSLLAALGAATCYGVAAVLQGIAVQRAAPHGSGVDPRLLLRLLSEGTFVISVLLNLLGFALHVVALQELPLFLVQVVLAASVAVTAVLSVLVLHAHLSGRAWGAIAALTGGLGVLSGVAESSEAATRTGHGLELALLAVVVVVAVAGWFAGRLRGAPGGALLGLVAGTGFGLVAVSARLLPTGLAPSDVVRDPAVVVLVLAGLVAFLLYATAMQHSSVTLATATLVLTQTSVPAVLGLLLLGDGVRSGTAPFAVLGFVLALVGATALARFEHVVPDDAPVPAR
ncbi:MAG: integral rane protein [Frankiales bacterium]|nr:integral rane protein [Frankiales bacterium]